MAFMSSPRCSVAVFLEWERRLLSEAEKCGQTAEHFCAAQSSADSAVRQLPIAERRAQRYPQTESKSSPSGP